MGVGQSAGWWEPTVRHYVGSIFVILGITLVIGSVFGRARWLIVVGAISAPLLFGAALLDVPLEGGFGDPRFAPDTLGVGYDSIGRWLAGYGDVSGSALAFVAKAAGLTRYHLRELAKKYDLRDDD